MVRTVKGLVLRSIRYGDFDKLVTILTEEGTLFFQARGIRSIASKNAAGCQNFVYSEFVLEQRGGEFAVNYREYIKEHFAEDIGLDYKTGNDVKNDVANCVLAGLVEMLLYELSSEIIPDEFTYRIGDGIIHKGVALTLNEDLNIKFGK